MIFPLHSSRASTKTNIKNLRGSPKDPRTVKWQPKLQNLFLPLLISLALFLTSPFLSNLQILNIKYQISNKVFAASLAQQEFFNDTDCTYKDPNGPIKDVVTIRGITCIIKNILKPIPSLIALTAFGMLLVGGVKIMTAGSDPKAYASGMQTIMWAVIGIILLSVVWLILVTIEKFTGAKVTNFGIPKP